MKKEIHRSEQRGASDLGWLHSRFSFSFADYYNPKRKGFGTLLVMNDDIIEPSKGFGAHEHDNMEIISIPVYGELAHKDNTGVQEIVKEDEIQVMSAGSGIIHSEYNASKTKKANFFQIWIATKEGNIKPRHDKKSFKIEKNSLQTVVSGYKDANTLYIHQNAKITIGKYDKEKETTYKITKGNGVFIFVIEGTLNVEGDTIRKRDSIEISETNNITITTITDSHFMIIEVGTK